jgi:phosphopantothenate---cysteine ligase (ATP)
MSAPATTAPPQAQQRDFTAALSEREVDEHRLRLGRFCLEQRNLRPICLVTSGGTAVDLEKHTVRSVENFSTGLRGAVSVEEFLRRGYAVVHLWRDGSASPYARVLARLLGLRQSNHGLNVDSMGRLFAVAGEDADDDLVQTLLDQEKDPFLATPPSEQYAAEEGSRPRRMSTNRDEIRLSRGLTYSSSLHKALRERSLAMSEGRLLTLPFRTVDEYLAKFQLCAQALSGTQSLALFFLAAAVSDYYIPADEMAEHKIQSGDGVAPSSAAQHNVDGSLTLTLQPVPKVMGLLKELWAPDAFVVSFKLETDSDVLRMKAERAVERYGCNMVIGNLLHSRHDKVTVLAPPDFTCKIPTTAKDWDVTEIVKPRGSGTDTLEASIIEFVVQSHFEFISWHFNVDGSGARAVQESNLRLKQERTELQRLMFWKKTKSVAWEVAGAVLTVWISYSINSAIQRRAAGFRG